MEFIVTQVYTKNNFEKENQSSKMHTFLFQMLWQNLSDRVWYWPKDRQIGQWNKIQSSGTNLWFIGL